MCNSTSLPRFAKICDHAFIVVVFLWLGSSNVLAQRTQWPATDGGNGHSYEIVPGRLTWFEARDAAKERGGYLATINSAAEDRFVQKLLLYDNGQPNMRHWTPGQGERRFGPWIGGEQAADATAKDAGWAWVTGEPFDYNGWLPTQPDDWGGGNERYLHYFMHSPTSACGWNDTFANTRGSVRAYIVEYPAGEVVAVTPPAPPSQRAVRPANPPRPSASPVGPAPPLFTVRDVMPDWAPAVLALSVAIIGGVIVIVVLCLLRAMALRNQTGAQRNQSANNKIH